MLTRKRAAETKHSVDTVGLGDTPPLPKKRAKNAPVRYTCAACNTEKINSSFPDLLPTPDCEHLINICKACLKAWIQGQVEDASFAKGKDGDSFGIRCPECLATMRPVNVEDNATKTVFKMFDQAHRRHIANTTPGWRWCLAAGCKAGQVHENHMSKQSQPKCKTRSQKDAEDTSTENQPDICTCEACGARACVTCDRPYHDGEDCQTYQRRTKDRMDEEEKSLKEVRRISKNCPGCSKHIQKGQWKRSDASVYFRILLTSRQMEDAVVCSAPSVSSRFAGIACKSWGHRILAAAAYQGRFRNLSNSELSQSLCNEIRPAHLESPLLHLDLCLVGKSKLYTMC